MNVDVSSITSMCYICLLSYRQDGYLFDKEAILEYILHQKRDISKKLKEFEKQKSKQKV